MRRGFWDKRAADVGRKRKVVEGSRQTSQRLCRKACLPGMLGCRCLSVRHLGTENELSMSFTPFHIVGTHSVMLQVILFKANRY